MPIYAYRCEQCGHELELLQKISDAPPVECPECGAMSLRKQLTAAGFRLKGGGWYETDFKGGGKRNVAGDREASGKEASGKEASGKEAAGKPKDGDGKGGKGGKRGDAGGKPQAASKPAAAAAAD